MYNYIYGNVVQITASYIIVDNHGIGYQINTPNPYSFNEQVAYKIYIYSHIREDEYTLYGFKTIEEKEMFLKLISVKGLGPKMTLPILATGSISGIIDAIDRENILYLKKFPKIGDKIAKQIVLDLKGKLKTTNVTTSINNSDELQEALITLGYKDKEIRNILNKVDYKLSIEEQIKEALKLLLK
ncbi:MAG: Holliday junction branch migration protein RuvA [Bacilli bacterium]